MGGSIPSDISDAVLRRVVLGDYGSVEAVLRAALSALDEKEAATASVAEVRTAIAEAIVRNERKASASAHEVVAEFEQVFAELEARRAEGIDKLRTYLMVGIAELDAGKGIDGEEGPSEDPCSVRKASQVELTYDTLRPPCRTTKLAA